MSTLSLGKLRSLQQMSNEFGIFTIAALDHRGSFETIVAKVNQKDSATWQDVVAEKVRLARALTPHASAVLLDPVFSIGPLVAQGLIPPTVSILGTLEASGYTEDSSGWNTNLIDGWTVEKIKRLGATAVKLLLYYHPQASNAASQEALLQQVAEDCDKYDIPLLVEPICFPLEPGQKKTDPAFAAQRPDIVLESARRLVPLGIDVLKAEFPTEASYAPHQDDEGLMRTYCRQLSDSINVPWVLLSAGVDFDTFQQQVGIACDEGCSGYLAGRAIWKEFGNYPDPDERTTFLNTVAVSRIRILNDVANYRGTPWLECFPAESLPQMGEGWFANY